ncbi:MAG: sulfatase-like hydrolase/transferase [Acidobacteriota bacterium]
MRWTRRAPFGLLVLLGLVLFGLGACSGGEGPPAGAGGSASETDVARDIVLISVDTLRFDAPGYTGSGVETPSIDRLASRGRVFTQARAHAVMTTPSHVSMLTGLMPDEHGVRDNGGFTLDRSIPTLATRLASAGFATGGFVGAYPLAAEKGLDQGFAVYGDVRIDPDTDQGLVLGLPNPRAMVGQRQGDEVVAEALEWWRRESENRRFLFVHLYDPHAPWAPPSPFKERYDDPYDGEVAWTDYMLEPLLSELADTPTLVIFTSDHGEAFGDHGEPTHGFFAYDSTLRVPLVLAGPGVAAGIDDRKVRHVDLVPTTLNAVGLEPPTDLPGRSLLDPSAEWAEVTYFESLSPFYNFGLAPLRGVVDGQYKLIEQPLPELYDLDADPAESKNLVNTERGIARRLLALLPDSRGYGLDERSLGEEERARLAALGYLDARSARGQSIADFGPEDDLKNGIDAYNRLRNMVAWLHDGRFQDVIDAAESLEEELPDSPLLYSSWAAAAVRRGDVEAGIDVIRRAMARDAASEDLRRQLGISLLRLGRLDEALRELEKEAARSPSEMTLNVLGHAHVQNRDAGSAETTFRKAAELYPESAKALENLSFLRLQVGDAATAELYARNAIERRQTAVGAWNNLGLALAEQGKESEAVEAWGRALELAPEHADVLFNHGLVSYGLGETAAARASLTRFLEVSQAPATDPRMAEARRLLGR